MAQAKFSNVDRDKDGKMDHFLVEFTNEAGSGSASLDKISLYLDGEEIPLERARLKIGEGDFQPLKSGMFVSGTYGDKLVIEIAKEGGLSKGKHTLKFSVDLEYMPYTWVCEGTI